MKPEAIFGIQQRLLFGKLANPYINNEFPILTQETPKERKERFKSMSSPQRQALIRVKMKAEGLQQGSGVIGVAYDEDEVRDLILITSYFPEMQSKMKP